MKMNAELKQRWVDALRSGNFKQGQGRLCTDDGRYCCLGVLEKVADGYVETHSTGRAFSMPTAEWLLEHHVQINFDELIALTSMNDGGRHGPLGEWRGPKSFLEIAAHIEATVEGVDEL